MDRIVETPGPAVEPTVAAFAALMRVQVQRDGLARQDPRLRRTLMSDLETAQRRLLLALVAQEDAWLLAEYAASVAASALQIAACTGGLPAAHGGVGVVPRVEVAAYAQAMERQLQAHDDRPGWKQADAGDLFAQLLEEVAELALAIRLPPARLRWMFPQALEGVVRRGAVDIRRVAVLREAADIGNMSMMVADVCGALEGDHVTSGG